MSNKKQMQKKKQPNAGKSTLAFKEKLIVSYRTIKDKLKNGNLKLNKQTMKQHKVKIAVASCATIIAATSLFLLPDQKLNESGNMITNSLIETNLNDVFFGSTYVGTIKDTDSIDVAVNAVISRLNTEDQQVYALPSELRVEVASVEPSVELRESEFEKALYETLVAKKNELLIQAFVVEVENGTTVTLDSLDQVKSAINTVTNQYLPEGESYEVASVDVNSNDADAVVLTKNIEEMALAYAEVPHRSTRTSSSVKETEEEAVAQVAGVAAEAEEPQPQAFVEGVVDVTFEDELKVKTAFVKQADVQTVNEAVDTLTDYEEEQVIYTIQSGDYPGKIAEENNMGLSDLYALNPGLKEKSTAIQIGQELIITQPDPNLSVKTEEIDTYEEPFNAEPIIEYDDSQYTTYSRVKFEGEAGIREITAEISKLNGKVVNREVIQEAVVKEPDPKIIVRGTMTPPQFISPVQGGRLTSGYGYRWGTMHRGIDIASSYGTNILASANGRVEHAGWMNGYGYLVIINHGNGYKTYYGHNSKLYVSVGEYVNQGQAVAAMGSTGNSTGNHCHFEIRYYGQFKNPANYIY